MARATLEVADIFRRHGTRYRALHRLLPHLHRLMRAIERCRTAALGGHVERCGHCSYQRIRYNSCRNRHCPKCQNLARAQWLERRKAELLPIPYFHVVFTIPSELNDLALQNKKVVYDRMFQTSAAALQSITRDPKHLGAEIGFFSVLHTWGQNLSLHPHIHSVVTGGGFNSDRTGWIFSRRPDFLVSVRVLGRRFRTLLLEALLQAFQDGQLEFHSSLERLRDPVQFGRLLSALSKIDWVVHAKPPFGGPQQVLEYLGRYTHRVAISNQRLMEFDGERVTFQYKDYRHSGQHRSKQMTLDADEFIRRFLLHALLPGFQRIRHYGILASSQKRTLLALARQLLGAAAHCLAPSRDEIAEAMSAIVRPLQVCPVCGVGIMHVIECLLAVPDPEKAYDSS
jgi:Putative transposase/Transposase zinc-binding domain